SLADDPVIYRDFYRRELETAAAANVQILELRSFLDFPTRPDGEATPAEALRTLQELYADVHRTYPDFRLRIIYSRERSAELGQIRKFLKDAVKLRQDFPEWMAGFDLVGQEQGGRKLADLVPLFQAAKYEAERLGTDLPLFLHASEGADADQELPNVATALLLGSRRIGHGLGLIDHPEVLRRVREQSIPLEVCLASSHILGNTAEISHHPARAWFRDGVRISVNPDDPGIMGCDLALDWYLAFVAWQLNLTELKRLILNGLEGCSLPPDQQQAVIEVWNRRWREWVADIDRTLTNSQ
ncbi:MAG: hypothetical protein JSS02_29465, partial [Planctomycetes bacterium]|nr:hypothetical protein [Planctomycetota bacterium]